MQVTYKFRLYPRKEEEKEGLKKVNSKTLQMVLFMLYNNLKALKELKKKGRKVGKLRYKKYGKIKSFILNQSDLNINKRDGEESLACTVNFRCFVE